jgi:hypothetical protein
MGTTLELVTCIWVGLFLLDVTALLMMVNQVLRGTFRLTFTAYS